MQKHSMVKKIPGVYDRTGRIKLTPTTEARLLVFPEKHLQDSDILSEHPAFEHEIDGSGYLEDEGPRGPTYSISALEIMSAMQSDDTEDRPLTADVWNSDILLAEVESDDPLQDKDTDDTCNEPASCQHCHLGACMFAGHIKERISRPAAAFAKFPRGAIPLSCAQCENY